MTFKLRPDHVLPALAIAALTAVLAFTPLGAQAQKAPGAADSGSGTNAYTLSKATFDVVTRIQKLIGSDNYSQAITVAQGAMQRAHGESDYAEALINQLIAQAYLLEKNYDASEPYLEKIVKLDALPPPAQESVIYELATIYLSQSKFDQSIHLYQQVLTQAAAQKKVPDPSLYYHLGLAYSFKGDYQQAYNYIEEGIQKRQSVAAAAKGKKSKEDSEEQAKPVPKDWYQNLFIVVYRMKNYQKANDIAKFMVAKWPNEKDFWNYYVNTYLFLKDDRKATAVYALMYKRGLLKSRDDYLQLVSLYNEQQAPYKAAELLAEAIDKGIVPKTVDNYELLANSWSAAQEWDKALDALGKEAALAPTGEVYLRQASIYLSQQHYRKAVDAAQEAIDKGGLAHPGRAWMILGQAAYQANEASTALKAFHKAQNYKSQSQNAKGWIQYVIANRKSPGGDG
ncbi:MAG: tetratricopeptide repeat protein [Acidimicrobiales bacterium]